jgi:hypothetical protein
MPIDESMINGPWTTDPNEDGLYIERHPDGQLKTVLNRSCGEISGPTLHLDPGALQGEVRETRTFRIDDGLEGPPQAQYETWITDAMRPICDRAHFVRRCSFCEKTSTEVFKLISGTHTSICNECIDLCSRVLESQGFPGG